MNRCPDNLLRLAGPKDTPSGEHRIPSTLAGACSLPSEGVALTMTDTLRILRLADTLSRTGDLTSLCRALTQTADLGLDFQAAAIVLTVPDGGFEEIARFDSYAQVRPLPGLSPTPSRAVLAAVSGEDAQVIPLDPSQASSGLGWDGLADDADLHSLLVIPLRASDASLGAVLVWSNDIPANNPLNSLQAQLLAATIKTAVRASEARLATARFLSGGAQAS